MLLKLKDMILNNEYIMCDWKVNDWGDVASIATMAAAIGTIGTFIKMICDSKNKTKQLESIQKIESIQLNALYAPDIRIDSYWKSGDMERIFNISNNGENLQIVEIKNSENSSSIVYVEGMKNWFPKPFDKGEPIQIPILPGLQALPQNFQFDIVVKNKLNQTYVCTIKAIDGKVLVCSKIKQDI